MTDSLRIRLIAPSGFSPSEDVSRGIERLHRAGCEVEGEEATLRRHLRFAGTDAQRAEDINQLVNRERPLPDIVMAVRGGYGMHRILDRLDYEGLRDRLYGEPVMLVGHSDVTALNLALLARSGLVSFAGPMLGYDFGGEQTSSFTREAFRDLLRGEPCAIQWQAETLVPVNVSGMLWGGNLATVCSLMGTPYFPDVDGGVLFIEDVNEPLFRIERMLRQLQLAGVLERQQALLLGDLSGSRDDAYDPAYDLDEVVDCVRAVTRVPVVTGLPFGHRPDKLTLPVGAIAHLDVSAQGTATLGLGGYPHLAPGRPWPTAWDDETAWA